MAEVVLKEQTQQWLIDPILGHDDIDAKVRRLLEAEYLRKMAQYERINQMLAQKYGLTFAEFVAQDVVTQRNYAWGAQYSVAFAPCLFAAVALRCPMEALRCLN